MRQVSGFALVAASALLSGCLNSKFDSLTSLQTGCAGGTTNVTCTSPTPIIPPTPTAPGGKPIVNTGNNADVPIGDTTIALESSVNTTKVNAPAVSTLLDSPLNRTIANGNAAAAQQIWFNTGTATNGYWPVSKNLLSSDYGTCSYDGGVGTVAGLCAGGTGGHALGGDYKLYRSYKPQSYDEELQVWTWNQSYATQYRDVTASGTDPQHQAWSFGGNYTTAAAMPTTGGATYTGYWTATAKTANYDSAKTGLVVPLLDGNNNPISIATRTIIQTVPPSNDWRVKGVSQLNANFGLGTLSGRLSSTDWQGKDIGNGLTWVDPIAAKTNDIACQTLTGACSPYTNAGQAQWQNWINYNASFMSTDVKLSGDIKLDPAAKPPLPGTTNVKPNQVYGTAVMDPNNGWITDDATNTMFAGFFGSVTAGKPKEVTGAFSLKSTLTGPNSGFAGINNDRRWTIQMDGIFNGQ